MPGMSTSKKNCYACVNSCFSLLNTKCTYAKHDHALLSYRKYLLYCWGRDGCAYVVLPVIIKTIPP